MGIFSFLKKESKIEDIYTEFDSDNHYRPKISRGEFFKNTDYDLAWLVLSPISDHFAKVKDETKAISQLSPEQKLLNFWWYLDGQVKNGGFVQFYYNGYGKYVPSIITGLQLIDDQKTISLLNTVHKEYLQNEKKISQTEDLFNSDLYDELDFGGYDDQYYDLSEITIKKIGELLKSRPETFCLDEKGKEINPSHTGQLTTYYENGAIKEQFELIDGKLDGTFQLFHLNGNLQEASVFKNGVNTNEIKKFYENGNPKFSRELNNGYFIETKFYTNGNKKEESHLNLELKKDGNFTTWYENGQKNTVEFYNAQNEIDKYWDEYYPDGSPKVKSIYENGKRKITSAWNKDGDQTLANGTGVYEFYQKGFFEGDAPDLTHQEYMDYLPHGIWLYHDGEILERKVTYVKGKRHGVTEEFYNNGRVKERTTYENGKQVSEEKFDKFKNPYVKTTITFDVEEQALIKKELPTADKYPVAINNKELENNLEIPLSLFDGYDQDRVQKYRYWVEIDEKGNVTSFDFTMADNAFVIKQVEGNLSKLKFEPAIKDGKPIKTYLTIRHNFELAER